MSYTVLHSHFCCDILTKKVLLSDPNIDGGCSNQTNIWPCQAFSRTRLALRVSHSPNPLRDHTEMFFLIAGWREISDSNKVNRQKSHTKKTWQNPKPPTKIVVNYLCLSFFFLRGVTIFRSSTLEKSRRGAWDYAGPGPQNRRAGTSC